MGKVWGTLGQPRCGCSAETGAVCKQRSANGVKDTRVRSQNISRNQNLLHAFLWKKSLSPKLAAHPTVTNILDFREAAGLRSGKLMTLKRGFHFGL